MKTEIAILDFGSQYTHLIARRVRELGIVSHIYHNDVSVDALNSAYGIILSGGPKSTLSDDRLSYNPKIFELNIPILGLCYGHQLIAKHFGGTVSKGIAREYGSAALKIFNREPAGKSNIFFSVPQDTLVWMSHGDHVEKLPDGFAQIASTGNDSVAAMADETGKIYGFQFHPEVTHTEHGKIMLQNFVFGICQAKKNWSTDDMLDLIQNEIREQAKDKKVFLLLSGGVDSTVCFALLEKTLGKDKVYGFHIDHGFMRKNETAEVTKALTTIGADNIHVYNASAEYFTALANITEPEEKRKIIGNLFLDITDRVMKELNFDEKEWLLGQGTIYPDTIESGGTKNADKIKTHHNRVDRIHEMIAKGLIIEPIKELYKDEVREIGRKLGLPSELVDRQPFPGPGLAIRCLCSSGSNDTPTILEENDDYSVLKLPIKSVGVQGDERSYAHPAILLPKISPFTLPPEFVEKISPSLTNTYKEINRVLTLPYGNSDKLSLSRVKMAYLTKERIELLREIDAVVNKHIIHDPFYNDIWQMPIVLVPFGHTHGESIVLRPFASSEVMTARFGKIHKDTIDAIVAEPIISDHIDFIFHDVTNKPPGTIEWE